MTSNAPERKTVYGEAQLLSIKEDWILRDHTVFFQFKLELHVSVFPLPFAFVHLLAALPRVAAIRHGQSEALLGLGLIAIPVEEEVKKFEVDRWPGVRDIPEEHIFIWLAAGREAVDEAVSGVI